jgi:urease accessory protein
MRARYPDERLPDMAFVSILSPGGGVLQGDRLEMTVDAAPGARLSLDTTSATRLYRMPAGDARMTVRIHVAEGAYVEYVPEPSLPYAGARFAQLGSHEVVEGGVLVLGEVVAPGRAARGEILAYDRFLSVVEVSRPGASEPLFRDVCRLEPGAGLGAPGLLGGHLACGSLHVVAQGLSADVLDEALDPLRGSGVYAGCSELPGGAGAWLRVLAPDSATAAAAVRAAWRAARLALTGAEPPPVRKY